MCDSSQAEGIPLAVCGLHLTGQPLNYQLLEHGARLLKACKSSHHYRFYAIPGQHGRPTKPGMVYVTDGTGNSIQLEIWEINVEQLGRFLLKVPPPLAIGTVQLESGDSCLGFIAEGYVMHAEGNVDITHFGSWLTYVEQQS